MLVLLKRKALGVCTSGLLLLYHSLRIILLQQELQVMETRKGQQTHWDRSWSCNIGSPRRTYERRMYMTAAAREVRRNKGVPQNQEAVCRTSETVIV